MTLTFYEGDRAINLILIIFYGVDLKSNFLQDGNDAKVFSADDSILTVCSSPVVMNSGSMLKNN